MNEIWNSDEYDGTTTDSKRATSTKWLKSSNASFANLQQVKPVSVYNFGIANKQDLKPTNLSSQRSSSYTNLVAEPVLQPVGLQKTAWGSNGSIPDLLKGCSKISQRPGSAKSDRKYPAPGGRRQRPQSANNNAVKQGGPGIAVKGAKYDPSGRPPKSFASTTGWIGPPAGLKFSEETDGNPPDVPPAPAGSPTSLHIDVDLQSQTTQEEDDSPRLKYTHADPPIPQTPPRVPPAPIHLMLPSMYDDVEEQDEDELNTDRLLQMADEHIDGDRRPESVVNGHHPIDDLPGYTYTFVNSHHSHESKLEVHGEGESEILSWEKEDINQSLDFSDSECSEVSALPGNDPDNYSHPHPLEKVSVKFSDEKNVTIDITPRNTGHKVAELMRKKPDKTDDPKELLSSMSVSGANAQFKNEINKNKVSLTEMKHENKSVRTLTNHKSYTRSEKPTEENLEFKFSSLDKNKCEKSVSNRPKSAVNRPTTPLTSVTVAYCDIDNSKKKKKNRGLTSEKDIITMVQQCQVSDSDEENQTEVITPDKLEPWMTTKATSQKAKNYYELARQSVPHGKNSTKYREPGSELASGAPLLKTTKTIELDEAGGEMKEVKSQSFIPVDRQPTAYLERDRQQREATRVRTKPRPASEMTNRSESIKNTEKIINRSEQQKSEPVKQNKLSRPLSAPSQRRPMSASRPQNVNKKPVKCEEKKDDVMKNGINTSCPIHSQDNMDQSAVGVEETVAMETGDDQMSDYDPGSESDHDDIEKTEKDLEIEKIIERHLGKPSRPVDLSTKENKSQNRKPTTSTHTKVTQEKKTTAHTHLHCNCPSNSVKEEKKVTNFTVQLPSSDKVNKRVYGAFARQKSAPSLRAKPKETSRPRTGKPVFITSKIPDGDFETEENVECQQLQARLAANGVHIKAETLERALYPPSGKTKYYEVNATLPKSSSSNLLSHPKEWLPVEYRQLKLAEKALNRANEIMYRQRIAEDRKARLTEMAKKKMKGKKKGKTKDESSSSKIKS